MLIRARLANGSLNKSGGRLVIDEGLCTIKCAAQNWFVECRPTSLKSQTKSLVIIEWLHLLMTPREASSYWYRPTLDLVLAQERDRSQQIISKWCTICTKVGDCKSGDFILGRPQSFHGNVSSTRSINMVRDVATLPIFSATV